MSERISLSPVEWNIRAAMSEAVIVAANIYREPEEHWPPERANRDMLRYTLRSNTRHRCDTAVLNTIYTLTATAKEDFEAMLVLTSRKIPDNPDTHFNRKWAEHWRFLLRDTDGIYYSGSPANYFPNPSINTHLDLYKGNLETVMQTIANVDGGLWPSADSITEILPQADALPNIRQTPSSPWLDYLQIAQEGTISRVRKGEYELSKDTGFIFPY